MIMTALAISRSALGALLARALVLWALVRTLVTLVYLLMPSYANEGSSVPPRPSPIAVVILCTLIGIIDLRRRREVSLWANLGLSTAQLALLFAVAATIGESVTALVGR